MTAAAGGWDERDTSANVPSPTALAATWDCGRVEAGGRLPTTWPASEEGLPSTQPAGGVLSYAEGPVHRLPGLRP
jgi:hypothetical protein